MSVLLRAYELADSGNYKTVSALATQLKAEGFGANALSPHGRALVRSLGERCRTAWSLRPSNA